VSAYNAGASRARMLRRRRAPPVIACRHSSGALHKAEGSRVPRHMAEMPVTRRLPST